MRIILVTLLVLSVSPAWADEKSQYVHKEYFQNYEGTKTCLECHEDAAESFFHSLHYQWRGSSSAVVNAKGEKLGKMNSLNDFCTNPLPSWIGNALNEDGKVLAQGCSKCHAGLGKMPSETISQEQLENIDCLICHASGYRRDLYQDENGDWEWKSILWKNQEGLNSVSKRISLPTRKMCLRCHSGAGGGPNYKRGDLEYALADCDRSYDVHMGTDGGDMSCIDCHAGSDHRVRGRGVDLAGLDLPGERLTCSIADCHGDKPHEAKVLNHHSKKIYCAVCHIPEYAKTDATDMARDWSRPQYLEDKKKYAPTLTLQKNVQPDIAWFNGKTRAQLMGEPVKRDDDGVVTIMRPEGKRKDKQSKLYAFKLHQGVLPVLKEQQWLLPIAVDEFFVSGQIDHAVNEGATAAYGVENAAYDWVRTERYMGIFHGVQPATEALQCLDCHSPNGRMNWRELGYKKDPLDKHVKD
jgi:hypothetical protein